MTRRALTLLEVLASLMLLSIVMVSCWPLLRDAAEQLQRTRQPLPDVTALDLTVESILSGMGDEVLEPGYSTSVVTEEVGEVSVEVLSMEDTEQDYMWVAFTCTDAVVLRWLPWDPDKESQ